MVRQPKDLEYRAEYAKPGEGPGNDELWLKCARLLLGCDLGLVCKELNQEQAEAVKDNARGIGFTSNRKKQLHQVSPLEEENLPIYGVNING